MSLVLTYAYTLDSRVFVPLIYKVGTIGPSQMMCVDDVYTELLRSLARGLVLFEGNCCYVFVFF